MWTSAGVTTRTLPPPPLSPRHQSQPAHHPHCRCSWTGWAGGQCGPLPGCCFCNWCLHHHHLSSDQSGQGAARHGMQHNIAHILILPLLHQRDMKIIQLRSAGDFSCALRELRLLLLSPPASAGGELASKDTFPPAEAIEFYGRTCLLNREAGMLLYSSAFII